MTNLQQRIISGLVLGGIALGAIMVGGEIFFSLLAILCVACLYEVWKFYLPKPLKFSVMAYVLLGFGAAYTFHGYFGWIAFLILSGTIILTDVGAYLAGKTIGGPKIAPLISPNKTWAGAIGGLLLPLAFIAILFLAVPMFTQKGMSLPSVLIMTIIVAISAQMGDLFESWLKRRAGVKDSSNFIPGHGGFFDRLDSWIAASFVNGLIHAVLVWF